MGGGQVGKGGKVKQSDAEQGLLGAAKELISEAKPLRQEVMGQTLEAMRTGGVGAQLPIVQKGMEASRAATSSALTQQAGSLGRQGLGRSSYGNALQASTLLQGELATQAIPQEVAAQFIAGAPSLMMGVGGQGMQGLSTGAGAANQRYGIQASRDIAKGNQQVEYVKAITSLAGAAGAGACWIAARLWGEGSIEYVAARHYIFHVWRGPHAAVARWLYLRCGERIARHGWACEMLRPLFERAVARGVRVLLRDLGRPVEVRHG